MAALAEFIRFHCATTLSSAARRPIPEVAFFAEAHSWTKVVTSALIQLAGWDGHPGPPLVSTEVAFVCIQAGCAVHRDAVVALPADHTSHGWATQSALPEWKFHRLSFALVTRASEIGAVFHVMNDRAVRGVPSAFLVPGLPRSSSVSVDQSRVSPCWT